MEKQLSLWEAFPIYGYENNALISKEKGCLTIPIQLELPEVFTLNTKEYEALQELFFNIISQLGPHRLLHRQDFFLLEKYTPVAERLQGDFMERGNEGYFDQRPFLKATHFLYISIVPKNYLQFNAQRANSFLKKNQDQFWAHTVPEEFVNTSVLLDFEAQVTAIANLINDSGLIRATLMDYDALFGATGLYATYFGLTSNPATLCDVDFVENGIHVGQKKGQFFTVENLDQFTKDHITSYEHYGKYTTPNQHFPIGNLFSLGFKIPHEHIINQYIYIPDQEKVLQQFRKKAKRFHQFSNGRPTDSNLIYAQQAQEFTTDLLKNHKQAVYYHLNVLGIAPQNEKQGYLTNNISAAFKKLRIQAKENTIDRKNLFFGGVPGNAVGISSELYMPMSSDMAAALLYFEGGSTDSTAVDGLRLVDRISGRPLTVSVYRQPEQNNLIFNRGMLVASGSGGGKSYLMNHYIVSELRQGGEAIIMEDGNSYDKITQTFKGVILEHDDKRPFSFNPFLLEKNDVHEGSAKEPILNEGKLLHLVTLLCLITEDDSQSTPGEIKTTLLELLVVNYYGHMWHTHNNNFKFDTFFEYTQIHLASLLKTHKISQQVFDSNVFLFLLTKYYANGVRGTLLNKQDTRISNLSNQKLIYFKLGKLIDNALLFPITALMIMDIFNKKMHDPSKRAINKILAVDEAWKALDKPELAHYFNGQSRMARKMGGQPIFISQKVDDFIASKIIRDAIVINSHIKVFLDMRDFIASFDKIQGIMGLGEKQKQLILSLNKDLPEHRHFREVAFCWMDSVKVYGVETSLEEQCMYETSPTESDTIQNLYQINQNNWELTAKAYAYEKSKK